MEKTKTKKRGVPAVIAGVLALALLLWLCQALLVPKYASASPEGNLIREYYNEKYDHDVIFVGDCEVYENFSPVTLWREYGVTSYIRGSSQQLIWQSYYLLRETFRRETPRVVVFNVLSMEYGTPQKEAYNRMTLDGMRWSADKLGAIRVSMMPEETLASYLFPLLRFHSRWSELKAEDFRYLFTRKQTAVAGYLIQTGVKPVGTLPVKKALANPDLAQTCWDYLDAMRQLCEENGAAFVLIKAPSLYPYWYDEWDQQVAAYAEKYGLPYLNMLDLTDEIGLDFSTDTYDGGLHLNVSGAEKLARWFGAWLTEQYDLPDHTGDAALAADWADKAAWYDEQIRSQTAGN